MPLVELVSIPAAHFYNHLITACIEYSWNSPWQLALWKCTVDCKKVEECHAGSQAVMSLLILLGNISVTAPITILFVLCGGSFVSVWFFFLGHCVLHQKFPFP